MRNEWLNVRLRDILFACRQEERIAGLWATILHHGFDARFSFEEHQQIWDACMTHPSVHDQYWVDG